MESNKGLLLTKYYFDKINFKLNQQFIDTGKNYKYTPILNRSVVKISDDEFETILSLQIKEKEFPFDLDLQMCGFFELQQFERQENNFLVQCNSAAIMFPFLRAFVANITTNANINQLVLPVINMEETMKDKNKKENK